MVMMNNGNLQGCNGLSRNLKVTRPDLSHFPKISWITRQDLSRLVYWFGLYSSRRAWHQVIRFETQMAKTGISLQLQENSKVNHIINILPINSDTREYHIMSASHSINPSRLVGSELIWVELETKQWIQRLSTSAREQHAVLSSFAAFPGFEAK